MPGIKSTPTMARGVWPGYRDRGRMDQRNLARRNGRRNRIAAESRVVPEQQCVLRQGTSGSCRRGEAVSEPMQERTWSYT